MNLIDESLILHSSTYIHLFLRIFNEEPFQTDEILTKNEFICKFMPPSWINNVNIRIHLKSILYPFEGKTSIFSIEKYNLNNFNEKYILKICHFKNKRDKHAFLNGIYLQQKMLDISPMI